MMLTGIINGIFHGMTQVEKRIAGRYHAEQRSMRMVSSDPMASRTREADSERCGLGGAVSLPPLPVTSGVFFCSTTISCE